MIFSLVLNLGTRQSSVDILRPRTIYPLGGRRCTLNRRLFGLQICLEASEKPSCFPACVVPINVRSSSVHGILFLLTPQLRCLQTDCELRTVQYRQKGLVRETRVLHCSEFCSFDVISTVVPLSTPFA